MKLLFCVLAVAALSGCAKALPELIHELAPDPAIVKIRAVTAQGTFDIVRVGGSNRVVNVTPDGALTVGEQTAKP